MKKILLGLLLTIGLHADPYFGFGGMFTDKDREHANCRVYVAIVGGYKFTKVTGEFRYYHVARGDVQLIQGYIIMPATDNLYGLVGWEKVLDTDGKPKLNLGIGYNIGNNVSAELLLRDKEIPTFGIIYRF